MHHVPVLLKETIDGLQLVAGATVVDATLGAGGHSSEIVRRFGKTVRVVGFDLDSGALAIASAALKELGADFLPVHANFRTMLASCEAQGITEVDAVLFDLGISSMEIGESGRGFSFKYDEPLLMTLTNPITEDTLTAREVVNSMSEKELADIIYQYGEERYSRQIAKVISVVRRREKITSSLQLAEIVADSVPASYRNGRINPATKTFQALRMYVNDELGAAEEGIRAAWQMLKPGGRLAVITFHSLEDRLVKNLFKEITKEQGTIITKKPIPPTRTEIIANPRSRSAKLRIIQKNEK
jgi:16S rRNA (cytosine1402-N4)-methyltransferase